MTDSNDRPPFVATQGFQLLLDTEARQVLDEMLACAQKWYVPPVQIAFVYLSVGEKEKAFDMLEKAYEQRSWELVFMRTEPWLDELHTDPRFEEVMSRLNFPPQ